MRRPSISGYDVIGDVHGHVQPLRGLLEKLGYRSGVAGYAHPERHAIFVGDLIDRGPDSVGVVELVQMMVKAGNAKCILGNHEFNAIAYATRDPRWPFRSLRRHTKKNRHQHHMFLSQVKGDKHRYREIIAWFMTLPMWCELSLGDARLRVVHASWHESSIKSLMSALGTRLTLTSETLIASARQDGSLYHAVENVLKGPEICMRGQSIFDKEGNERHNARVAWWRPNARSLRELAHIPEKARDALIDIDIDTTGLIYTDDIPVIFGHYWFTGDRTVLSGNATSVDYSVANGGPLVAYQWNGEQELSNDRFVAFP